MGSDDCCICHPANDNGNWMLFCNEHEPPKGVVMPHIRGEDSQPLYDWVREQQEMRRSTSTEDGDG